MDYEVQCPVQGSLLLASVQDSGLLCTALLCPALPCYVVDAAAAADRKVRILNELDVLQFWTRCALDWDPVACESANFSKAFRLRGRPFVRWHDGIELN